MTTETMEFKAEVAKMLDIVIHSLYSNNEIFLRELISNASDACDKLRYASLLHPDLMPKKPFEIILEPNKKDHTLTISDDGIGMNKQDLIEQLGTIAHSGSGDFLKQLDKDKKNAVNLIGQFGVGFYSAFMVAEKVDVYTKKAGETEAWKWQSDGLGSFSISSDDRQEAGTRIVLHLKKEAEEYLDPIRLRYLVRQYSNHISLPIILKDAGKSETINTATALWQRPKAEITETQYKDFYQSVSHAFDAPWATLHYKAEGVAEYTALMFIPTQPPFNLFQPDRQSGINLYVNRVFITDNVEGLMPFYLRFLTGVIDTSDLPLNVSREMLQKTPVLQKIKTGIVHRVLDELKKRSEKKEDYDTFWKSFGIVFKEGLYEPVEDKDKIAKLCRFYSTKTDGLVSFDEYVSRMKEGQEAIYYLTGSDLNSMRHNPQLEGFIARDIEVLLLNDPIDEFWTQSFTTYEGKKIMSVMHADADLKKIKEEKQKKCQLDKKTQESFIKKVQDILKGQIQSAEFTDRLTSSPVSLITPEGQMSLHLERLMKAHGQTINFESGRILQINSTHPLIEKLAQSKEDISDKIWLLYDQARVIEGEPLSDPALFAQRLTQLLQKD